MIHFDDKDQNASLSKFRRKEQEYLAERLANKHGLQYTDLSIIPINSNAVAMVPEEESRDAKVVVFNKVNKKINIAVLSPEIDKTKQLIKKLEGQGFLLEIFVVSEESLKNGWAIYKEFSKTEKSEEGSFSVSPERIKEIAESLKDIASITEKVEALINAKDTKRNTTYLLELIMAGALSIEASDIHFEPGEESARLRYRLDGVLVQISAIPIDVYNFILSRIKLLSGLKLNASKAQDGRFSISFGELDIEIRSSIIPNAGSESIVLRILNPESIKVPLEELGMHPKLLTIYQKEIKKPHGMILTTGPTGSGKTTTLYASLQKIYSDETKVITIENPIEYHLDGIVQTQTDEKYGFAEGLRSALRQDPDVIMVGEIRDQETAETAINASLTGHLVFSTLHTNTAAGTFPRLIDLGVNPKIITSALNLSLAQRLIRKLCSNCKKERETTEEEKEKINKILDNIKDKSYIEEIDNTNSVYGPVGCEKCNNLGYKGRVGIYEAIISTEAVEKVILGNPSEREILEASQEQNIPNMLEDGILKVLNGITSLEELESEVSLD